MPAPKVPQLYVVKNNVAPAPPAAPLPGRKKRKRRKWPPGVVVKNKRWYVRVRYHSEDGQRHAAWRECDPNADAAKDAREALRKELRERKSGTGVRGPLRGSPAGVLDPPVGHENMSFKELADYYEQTYLVPAKFIGDRLVSGRRSLVPVKAALKPLLAFFGDKPIRSITHGNLETLKLARLDAPVVYKKTNKQTGRVRVTKHQRSITTVNKELRLLRRMFNVALQEEWLEKNPFARGDSLISSADETKRQRILNREEEQRLLALCVGKRRAHLRPLIICAVDTGMRWGEMNKLRAVDLNFGTRVITIQATHTKTLLRRRVKMTARVAAELQVLAKGKRPTQEIFTNGSVKHSWQWVRREAGLEDLRWHDLRHTNATRIEKSKRVSIGQLSRHLGHSDSRSTERYINQDEDAVVDIAAALEEEG
jgi:integrase